MIGQRVRKSERGFTVIELVVATSVLLIFTAFALQFLATANSDTSRTAKDVATENDARNTLRQMTEDIRAADPITATYPSSSTCPSGVSYPAGYPSCLSFTVVRSTATNQTCTFASSNVHYPFSVVTYGLVSGAIKADRTDYNSVDGSGNCVGTAKLTTKTILSNVVNPSGTNLFRFFDSSGNELSTSAGSAAFQSAASVMVTLVVQYQSGAPNITVSSTAALRNNRG